MVGLTGLTVSATLELALVTVMVEPTAVGVVKSVVSVGTKLTVRALPPTGRTVPVVTTVPEAFLYVNVRATAVPPTVAVAFNGAAPRPVPKVIVGVVGVHASTTVALFTV